MVLTAAKTAPAAMSSAMNTPAVVIRVVSELGLIGVVLAFPPDVDFEAWVAGQGRSQHIEAFRGVEPRIHGLKRVLTVKCLLEHVDVAPDLGLDAAAFTLEHPDDVPRGSAPLN